MRVRPHIEAVAALEFRRAEVIEKDERPDCPTGRVRQRAADGEAVSEVDAARDDHGFEGIAGITVARGGVLAAKKTHVSLIRSAENAQVGAYFECREPPRGCQTAWPSGWRKRNLQARNAAGGGPSRECERSDPSGVIFA